MFLSKGRFGIKLIPLGKVPGDIQEYLTEALQGVFRKKVFRLKKQKIPTQAFDLNRSQYNSKELIEFLQAQKTYKEKIIGLINEDIFKPGFPFVFGEANSLKDVAVVSLWRFEQNMEFFDCDPELFKSRGKKEAIQKMGHIYGLRHCVNPNCVMFYSHTISDIDVKSDEFCTHCKDRL
ncbi:MAG: archaemetzincin family Zn-dependent metalloprotease [Candidatus Eremiobacteraeota bacterium]|nr:archaemetzincin family Zn-dependent metalloprotease [Candidatus Eremiobacteraeota bacterium]